MKRSPWVACLLIALAMASVVTIARGQSDEPIVLTPIVLRVARPPIPVLGSDGRYHLVYELELTNVTPRRAIIEHVAVLDATTGNVVQMGTRCVNARPTFT